ncbi:MAG TPA: carboxypeptidase regulatory-like domain-containing protein, partial [Pyrinomonadaceae bacterium]|nr:carboxypeptidase regulatory-like domain-containing protein [Pyrinomonadaceae bacterium]
PAGIDSDPSLFMKELILIVVVLLFAAFDAFGTTYEVKPNTAMDTIAEVPWASLQPGDTVLIYWKATAYKEKWVICRQGTSAQPITIRGVLGPNGERPVIDGNGATTPTNLNYWNENRGTIKIGGANIPADTMPKYITIADLEVRGAFQGYQFTRFNGQTQSYAQNAAPIYIEKAENLTIQNCIITDGGNGLFIGSSDDEPSRDILVQNNYIYGNGNVGSAFEHNNYTAAIGITFQYNRFGPLRAGAIGNALKDRSAGTVIRYNWIEGGNRNLDLVDGEDSILIRNDPNYHKTFVYGNVLIKPDGGNNQTTHYGGDSGTTSDYRKGTLYFYNNTIVSTRTGTTVVFRLSTIDETCDARNNIFYTTATGTSLAMLAETGVLTLTNNWVKTGWKNSFESPFGGIVSGGGTFVTGTSPGFVDLASQDFRLLGSGQAVNAGTALNAETQPANNVTGQYVKHQLSEVRPVSGFPDIGAFEFAAAQNLASISGQVTAPDGRALRNATVLITDSVGTRQTTTTSSFGLYNFDGIVTGQTYTVTVISRLYRFAPRGIMVTSSLSGIDLAGLE